MAKAKDKSPDYWAGYSAGYQKGKFEINKHLPKSKAYWIMRKDGWYCSNCKTKHEQAHDEFCCKCGAEMSEEADYEDNKIS